MPRPGRQLTLRDLVKAGKQPEQFTITYPGGFKARFLVVGPRHPALKDDATGVSCDGMSYDFGDKVPPSPECLPAKEARIFFNSSITIDRFLHTLFHELYHNVTEWTGRRHAELLEAKYEMLIREMEDSEED
jgi:hypothetical protein